MVYQVRTQKGNIFMEVQVTASTNSAQTNPEANIASQILARYRAVAKQYGRFFSEQIYTIVGTNPDLKYKEDVLNDKNTLRKEVTVFLIKPIDITGLKFLPKDFDGEPKIMLNPESNDPNLVFNLVPPQLLKQLVIQSLIVLAGLERKVVNLSSSQLKNCQCSMNCWHFITQVYAHSMKSLLVSILNLVVLFGACRKSRNACRLSMLASVA